MDKPLEPGVRKKGRNTFKVSQEYLKEDLQKLKNQKISKEKPTTMNKGGGMDMGKMPNTVKPEPRGNPGIVETVVGKGGDYIKDLID